MLKDQFIELATEVKSDTKHKRSELCELFDTVDRNVHCIHEAADAFYQADYILRNQDVEGPIVEFGCYKGGMSCKLSHVAELVGKKYVIFDSFEGLPNDASYQTYNPQLAFLGQFAKNQFASSLVETQINLQKYGMFFICEFYEGIIEDTLPLVDLKPSHVYIDVDLKETARFIIQQIYRNLNCKTIFTHEACLVDYMDAIMDDTFWRDAVQTNKPTLGNQVQEVKSGMRNSDCINCLIRSDENSEYINTLKEVK